MKNIKFLMIFLLISGRIGYADVVTDTETMQKETLRGIKCVNVWVEKLKPDIEKDGLKRSTIQTDVELKLRMAGIKVLTREESLKESGSPGLLVNVNSMKSDMGLYSFNISIQLHQWVLLVRDVDIMCIAVTWERGSVGYAGVGAIKQIRDGIKDMVDVFINDYLSVNPK